MKNKFFWLKLNKLLKELKFTRKFYILILNYVILIVTLFFLLYLSSFKNENKIIDVKNIKNIKYSSRFNQYRIIHEKILNGSISPPRLSINGFTEAGYGNKIYSMLTSMIIALLTDSALIIKWNDIDKYIEEPFKNTFNQNVYLNLISNLDKRSKSMIVEMRPKLSKYMWIDEKEKNLDEIIKTNLEMIIGDDDKNSPIDLIDYKNNKGFQINYNNIQPLFFEICSNPIYYSKLLEFNLTKQETINEAINILNSNRSNLLNNQIKSHKLFKIGYEVGGNLLNKLWKPRDYIQKQIDYYLNNKFKSNYVIGIQFRTYFLKEQGMFNEKVQSLIDCAIQIEKRHQIIENKINKENIKWFILSDDENLIKNLKQKYNDKIIIAKGTIGHVETNSNSYERAILDNELLSKCNDIILTRYSTFGFVASMKFHSYYSNNKDKNKMPFYSPGAIKSTDDNYFKCQSLKLGYIFF